MSVPSLRQASRYTMPQGINNNMHRCVVLSLNGSGRHRTEVFSGKPRSLTMRSTRKSAPGLNRGLFSAENAL